MLEAIRDIYTTTVQERQPAKVLIINTGQFKNIANLLLTTVVAVCVLCSLDIPIKLCLPFS